ncbi:SAM-dependent chlorinase/fluorinase [Cellulophaga baltica]|uniref:SAM hydrolase/SAM-dependent halogenase family protein n=1 Tax=Cellulophaga TaxID=104264 RepID=UPI001C074C90|nr:MULTISPECIES: SAM-dependent chlorinase/fluorinase [Cellulophaga]MBU2996823.1 SAM-dependent chlorinase/fluorinase [Cellulophaga baltica]MDO6768220.1 SAM-dependent chlorinase/fluorinase [Cellulophaga sp. 1_MG-2023]
MAIITLTTDFGYKDHFIGVIKGTIYSELADAKIVDISNEINPFNIPECAYILKNSYKSFPKGSIHIVGVDSELTPENQHIAVYVDGHYFVSANNGVISLITSEITPDKVVKIDLNLQESSAFPELDVFTKVACHIARGGTLDVVGKNFDNLKDIREFAPRVLENGKIIIGSVIYIDNFGNVITNIQKHVFEAYRGGRDFVLNARNKKITKIHNKYSDIINFDLEKSKRKAPGDLLALFNSSKYIELAIYKSDLNTVGGASTLLGLDYRDTISIEFI